MVFGILLLFTVGNASFSGVYELLCSGWAVILLAGVIPLAVLAISKRKAVKSKNEA